MSTDPRQLLTASRRILANLFGQVLSLALVPGAIAVAVAFRPAADTVPAEAPLWLDSGHGANCPICARSAMPPDAPEVLALGEERAEPFATTRIQEDPEPARTPANAVSRARDAG